MKFSENTISSVVLKYPSLFSSITVLTISVPARSVILVELIGRFDNETPAEDRLEPLMSTNVPFLVVEYGLVTLILTL